MTIKNIYKKWFRRQLLFVALLLSVLVAFVPATVAETVKLDYLFNLSDFNGVVPYGWVRLAVDSQRNEIYVTNLADLTVRVFSSNGMELYSFGDDGELGFIRGIALCNEGNMLVLSEARQQTSIIRTNYRGEQIGKLNLTNLPQGFPAGFTPEKIICRDNKLYLVDLGAMRVLVTDLAGVCKDYYDLGVLLGISEKKKRDLGMIGFSVDQAGDLLFTIPVSFQAYVVSPDRKVRSFGVNGSSPGKFNIIGGIAADDKGYLYIVDTLRCVIMVFTKKDFTFKGEFGYRGLDPGNLVAPMEVEIMADKAYVTQSMNRGVSVYRIMAEE